MNQILYFILLGFIGPQELIIIAIYLLVPIVILRLIGAWIFRINEVIKLQKEILDELKKINTKE